MQAKLKAHIHDPNAPELVHFLFTPLALIVDASRDSNHGANLPAEVVAPLLTRDAIDLLVNCLTSKESELWHSLGEAWCRPRYGPPQMARTLLRCECKTVGSVQKLV